MFEGQPNFRDLGGIPAGEGSVVTGAVFRSGELSGLTDTDLAVFESLGIRTVVDLRSGREAGMHPDRLPASAEYVPLPILPGGPGSSVGRFMETFDPSDFPPWSEVYRSLVRHHTAELAALMRLIADGANRPVVFHCGTGKDRTGVASALLLAMLETPWADIEEDFLVSNALLQPRSRQILDRWERGLAERGVQLGITDRSHLEQFLLVDRSFLRVARAEMISMNGSVEAYIEQSLGIEEVIRDSLRAQLVVVSSA